MTILRTQRDGCWELRSNTWGQFLAPTVDPDADTVITNEQLQGFELHPDTPRIPGELWNRWINLCVELCKRGTGDLEVSCRLLKSIEDPTQYRIFVPIQKVTGVSVRVESFDNAVDIETGEVATQWPPEGWRPCGSSHSHNQMDAFFSGTDDKFELGDPGLHIVVGKIDVETKSYSLCASITANHRRFLIDPDLVTDIHCEIDAGYSPAALQVISLPAPRTGSSLPKLPKSNFGTWGATTYTSPFQREELPADLEQELNNIRIAVDNFILEANKRNIDVDNHLSDLAGEIDDLAFIADPLTDPFYYDDYLL